MEGAPKNGDSNQQLQNVPECQSKRQKGAQRHKETHEMRHDRLRGNEEAKIGAQGHGEPLKKQQGTKRERLRLHCAQRG